MIPDLIYVVPKDSDDESEENKDEESYDESEENEDEESYEESYDYESEEGNESDEEAILGK